jgi:degradative hydroxymethylglutaryl-CoA reductase
MQDKKEEEARRVHMRRDYPIGLFKGFHRQSVGDRLSLLEQVMPHVNFRAMTEQPPAKHGDSSV